MATEKTEAARLSAESEVAFKLALKRAREEARISRWQLADLLGYPSDALVSRIERLDSDPRLSDIRHYLTQCGRSMRIEVV